MGVLCEASLNYVAPGLDGPAVVEVQIHDGRTADLPGWVECGFERVEHRSAVGDWDDDDEITAVHHVEFETLARSLTGCDHALVTSHIRRSPERAARHQDLAPIGFVHSDFAASYLEVLKGVFHQVNQDGARAALDRAGLEVDALETARRIVILQVWRNVGPPKMDQPLAFCDARTVRPEEALPIQVTDYAGSGIDFEALAVRAPDEPGRHGWYSFPELRADEAVVFRTYDTDLVRAGGRFFTPHSAFRDPEVPLGQPARSSVELRATCLFS